VELLHRIHAPIAGADIVELNPRHDPRDLTARVAAKLLKELVAVAIRNASLPGDERAPASTSPPEDDR
jgi:arginase family enzyme